MAQSSEHGMNDEFDRRLKDELGKGYVPFSATSIPAGAPYRSSVGRARPSLGRSARTAIVVAAIASGLMGTTALAATAVTGSANPQAWGQYVSDAVNTCKRELGAGEHGIGGCVRAIANQKGVQERDKHSNGNGASHAQPSAKGRPSGVPSGPPSSRP
jgi:hypothetical protein